MRDMESVYWNMSTKDLQRLKGKKDLRLIKLRGEVMTYSVKREIATLEYHLKRLNSILNSRRAQMSFDE